MALVDYFRRLLKKIREADVSVLGREALLLYRREQDELLNRRLTAALCLGIVLIPFFSLLDLVLCSGYFKLFLGYRLGCAAIFGGLLFFHLRPAGKRHAHVTAGLATFFAGLTISAMVVQLGGYDSVYYVGLALVLVTCSVILPLTPLQAILTGMSLYLIYAGPVLIFSPATPENVPIFFNNSFFFFSFVVVTTLQCWVENRSRIREFILKTRLDESARKLQYYARHLEQEVEKRARELVLSREALDEARTATILGLARLAEYRDRETGYHLERIREYVRILAEGVAENEQYRDYVTKEYIDDIYLSSILHDIGKVGIPDAILLKPARLTGEEYEIIKQHTILGGNALKEVEGTISGRSFLSLAKEIAFHHHERWDGTGYPSRLKGEDIPLSTRFVALADVYDALTSARVYKEAYPHQEALRIIASERGQQFCPMMVDVFLARHEEFDRIRKSFQGTRVTNFATA